jgi:hypothetical protein
MTVLLPSVRADGTRTTFQPLKEDESMLAQCVKKPSLFHPDSFTLCMRPTV